MRPLHTAKTVSLRTKTGSLNVFFPAAILIAIVGIGAFAMDISHNVTVRTELQSATDAAALAGARDLLEDRTLANADATALDVAEQNTADGQPVSNNTQGTQVFSTSDFDRPNLTGTVDVNAERNISNLFAKLFGHKTDPVTTHSKAQCWRSITGVKPNYMFPLTVSIDTMQGLPKPIYQMSIGDQFNMEINSQQWKNAAFTSFTIPNPNANFITDAVEMLLGMKPMQNNYIPGINTGDQMSMINGVAAQKQLAKGSYLQPLTDPNRTIIIPVMKGEPPYNQNRAVAGFITVKIKSIKINNQGQVETITATLAKGVTKGTGGEITGNGTAIDNGLENISAGTVQLVN